MYNSGNRNVGGKAATREVGAGQPGARAWRNGDESANRAAMGIKFYCPQGHKINAKPVDPATGKPIFGKKAICPKCGAKVVVPATSDAGLEADDAEETDLATAAAVKGNGASAASASAVTESPAAAKVAAPAVSVKPAAEATSPAAAPATSPATDDPIAEQPAAIWYVRPPGGAQYGPARGEVMRKWLSEGRVSGDSLVWREGWTDWQTAGELFPQLKGASEARAEGAAPTVSAAVPRDLTSQASLAPRTSARAGARYQAKQQSTSTLGVGILIGLAVICLALVAVLVYVLLRLK